MTTKGVEQANTVARKIKDSGLAFDAIYSSPLRRAYRTAEIISEILGVGKPEVMPELIERDFGIMTGQLQSSIESACSPDILKTETITYFLKPEGAETFPQLLVRARSLLDKVMERHADGSVLLVTHGDLGKMIYAAYYAFDWLDILKMFHFGNSELLELSGTSKPEDTHVFKIQQHNL